MTTIERKISSITEDRRADYLWPTKAAAAAVGMHPNKFGAWWYANRKKLVELAATMPGETSAELMAVMAEAAMRIDSSSPDSKPPSRPSPR